MPQLSIELTDQEMADLEKAVDAMRAQAPAEFVEMVTKEDFALRCINSFVSRMTGECNCELCLLEREMASVNEEAKVMLGLTAPVAVVKSSDRTVH